jgi:predicted metalloendopeptidase
MHGFIPGQQYDKDGVRRMMWSNESQEEFNNRLQCFRDQYNEYTFEGVQVIIVVDGISISL